MLLSYTEICQLLEQGVVQGAHLSAVNAASLDVHLGPDFLTEQVHGRFNGRVDLRARQSVAFRKKSIDPDTGAAILVPGEFALASTAELFNLPNDVSAEFRLKSSIARNGLEQLAAVWADAGWNRSALTLELFNATRAHDLLLHPGLAIGQMIFHRHTPVPDHASYAARGRYNNNPTTQNILPWSSPVRPPSSSTS